MRDPFEAQNRDVHEINRDLDKNIVRPVSQAYGTVVPEPVRRSVGNFSSNLDLPGFVLNDLLQLRLDDAVNNAGRFLFNSTIGLAGLFDPASTIGMYERDTDFGETLHKWGVGEGAYVELPLLGPSTERDTVGKVVDYLSNPTRAFVPVDVRNVDTVAGVADLLGDRYKFSDSVDSILYESADSYAQARLLYLQNRRYELGGVTGEPEYLDVYEDPYAQ
ncbi:MlaA family lipoprotein [Actibacterium lipolyticum]|uniref:MlaA family lipoprotein n=1 Tax=Actibacterium lipolyticum TaxID=1524263 RepID=UPI001F21D053|nr:VacJ family lipoprotein [Actibacterium lipolyticum]